MFDPALKDGASVVTLGRASTTRDRLEYPANGKHALSFSRYERAAIQTARGRRSPAGFVRAAVLAAAGLPALDALHGNDQTFAERRVGALVAFRLTREERAAVDAARRERDLTAWLRESVRAAAGIKHTLWTACADAVLRKGFRRVGLEDLLRALPGRNAQTIYHHAWELGLSTELTDERVTIRQAVLRSGYSNGALLRMLAAANVKLETLAGTEVASNQRRHFVRWADVARVIAARGETVSEGARRLNVERNALYKAVADLGYAKPEGVRFWRLPSEVIERAASTLRPRRARAA